LGKRCGGLPKTLEHGILLGIFATLFYTTPGVRLSAACAACHPSL
jgi:hypothetical protein